MGDYSRVFIYQPPRSTQPGHHPCVGALSTGDGLGHCWGRNGEFCVIVGPVTRTASIYWPSRLKEPTIRPTGVVYSYMLA